MSPPTRAVVVARDVIRPQAETRARVSRLLGSLTLERETLAYAGLVAIALVLRLIALPDRAFHHDESEHGYFAWLFATGHGYHYDPILHGPVRDLVTGTVFFLFGASDWTARIGPALLGSALVALPYLLRRQVGSTAALATAALLCVSPTFLYYTRFDREDTYAIALTLALTVVVFRFLDQPRPWYPSVIFGLLAASFATKETTYITVFVSGTFFLLVAVVELRLVRRGRVPLGRTGLLGPVVSVGWEAWAWAGTTFLAVFTLLFTTFLSHPAGLQDGLIGSIRYWLSQQPVGRGSQPWFYYFVLLIAYELPAVVLAAVGVVRAVRRPSLLRLFLVWAVLVSLGAYIWAGEKMPWLLMHPLLWILLLAGIGVETLWHERRRLRAQVAIGASVLAAIPMVWGSFALDYRHSADPAEFLVFTQTAPDVVAVRDRLERLDTRERATRGTPLRLEVDRRDAMDWPWWWYLRDFRGAVFADMGDPAYIPAPNAQAILVAEADRSRLLPLLESFVGFRFHHRVWWVPDYAGASARDIARWFVFRKPWNRRGSLDEWLYLRKGLVERSGGT